MNEGKSVTVLGTSVVARLGLKHAIGVTKRREPGDDRLDIIRDERNMRSRNT